MNLTEAKRTRNFILRLDRGDELPEALLRALAEAEVRAGWITGVGAVEAAELMLHDQRGKTPHALRRIDTPCELCSLSGNVSTAEGVPVARLSAVLARETDVGLTSCAGQLAWARVFAAEIHVVAFDDVALTRASDERTGLLLLSSRGAPGAASPAPAGEAPRAETPRTETSRTAAEASPAGEHQPPLAAPHRLHRPTEVEVYPEVGDSVNHFHFGDCIVIGSDGDRIRLRQERDGRVREVSLAMLKIDAPITDADGKRLFLLGRKN
jgi:predicted DNA-binding protein with PD1-like motif